MISHTIARSTSVNGDDSSELSISSLALLLYDMLCVLLLPLSLDWIGCALISLLVLPTSKLLHIGFGCLNSFCVGPHCQDSHLVFEDHKPLKSLKVLERNNIHLALTLITTNIHNSTQKTYIDIQTLDCGRHWAPIFSETPFRY